MGQMQLELAEQFIDRALSVVGGMFLVPSLDLFRGVGCCHCWLFCFHFSISLGLRTFGLRSLAASSCVRAFVHSCVYSS